MCAGACIDMCERCMFKHLSKHVCMVGRADESPLRLYGAVTRGLTVYTSCVARDTCIQVVYMSVLCTGVQCVPMSVHVHARYRCRGLYLCNVCTHARTCRYTCLHMSVHAHYVHRTCLHHMFTHMSIHMSTPMFVHLFMHLTSCMSMHLCALCSFIYRCTCLCKNLCTCVHTWLHRWLHTRQFTFNHACLPICLFDHACLHIFL